jgi:hypothetical protein
MFSGNTRTGKEEVKKRWIALENKGNHPTAR